MALAVSGNAVFDLHDRYNLGWRSLQQLSLTLTREIFAQTVESFLDAGGARS